jgi:hypothetical protein
MKREEIVHFVEILLRKRFHDVLEKQKIEGDQDRKINFACPICGDSEKKVSKKRGNLYLDTGAYKCFNDGCMAYMTLAEFVAKMSREHGIMLPSFVLETEYKPVKVKRDDNQLIRFLTSDTGSLVTITDVINRFGLKRLDQIEGPSRALDYIKGRDLNLIDDFGDCLYADASDNKVFIFNFDRRSGRLLGFSMRSLDPNSERKYIIKSYTDLANIFFQRDLSKQLIEDANFLNNYFNILNIDFSKPILLAEGQFDSLLLDNCIATSGVSKAKSIMSNLGAKSGIKIIFDRDHAGKVQMMNFVKQGYSVFLWNKAIAELKKASETSQEFIQINRIKDINDLFSFLRKKRPGYSIENFNSWIYSHFSETVYDMVYL